MPDFQSPSTPPLPRPQANPREPSTVLADAADGLAAARLAGFLMLPWAPTSMIRRLGPADAPDLIAALMALDDADRAARFGRSMAEPAIRAYVDGLDWKSDRLFAILDRRQAIVASSHLAAMPADPWAPPCTELGRDETARDDNPMSTPPPRWARWEAAEMALFVAGHMRRAGLAKRLIQHAEWVSRNLGASSLSLQTALTNTPMRQLLSRWPDAKQVINGPDLVVNVELQAATAPTHWIEQGAKRIGPWQRQAQRWWQQWPLVDEILQTPDATRGPWRPM